MMRAPYPGIHDVMPAAHYLHVAQTENQGSESSVQARHTTQLRKQASALPMPMLGPKSDNMQGAVVDLTTWHQVHDRWKLPVTVTSVSAASQLMAGYIITVSMRA